MRRGHWSSSPVRDSSSGRELAGAGSLVIGVSQSHAGSRRPGAKPQAQRDIRSALSFVVTHLAVLGRQHRARPLPRRACSSDHARLHPLGRGLPGPAAVRRAASPPRLADHPQACRTDGRAGGDRRLRLQLDGLLRLAIYDRDQRPVVAIHRSFVCRAVDFCVVRRPADPAAGRRYRRVADRRDGYHLPRQPRRPHRHRLQSR